MHLNNVIHHAALALALLSVVGIEFDRESDRFIVSTHSKRCYRDGWQGRNVEAEYTNSYPIRSQAIRAVFPVLYIKYLFPPVAPVVPYQRGRPCQIPGG